MNDTATDLNRRLAEAMGWVYGEHYDLQAKTHPDLVPRIVRATELWRAEAPEERALTLPDLGKHIDWLIERGDKPLAALEALRNVPAVQRTLDWWSDMTSEEYSAKWGTGDTSGDEEEIAKALGVALGVKSHAEP